MTFIVMSLGNTSFHLREYLWPEVPPFDGEFLQEQQLHFWPISFILITTEPAKSCILVVLDDLLIITNFIWLCLGQDLTAASPAASSAVDFSLLCHCLYWTNWSWYMRCQCRWNRTRHVHATLDGDRGVAFHHFTCHNFIIPHSGHQQTNAHGHSCKLACFF